MTGKKSLPRIALYLMGEKGVAALTALLQKFGAESIDFVVAAQDQHVKNDGFCDLKLICERNDISFFCKGEQIPLCSGAPSYQFAIGWRWMLPVSRNLIVLHDSLLPRYRGFAPLCSALINGDTEIGATALFASREYDRGPIIAQKKMAISYPITIGRAISLMSCIYQDLVCEIVASLYEGKTLQSYAQNEINATYSLWRDCMDYRIDWSWSSEKICRFVDALGAPYLGAQTRSGEELYFIRQVEVVEDVFVEHRGAAVGKVIFKHEGFPVVVCGSGLIKLVAVEDDQGQSVLPLIRFRTRYEK